MAERALGFLVSINWRLFGLTLVVGLLCGAFVGGLSAAAAPVAHGASSPTQQNMLIALVEDAQAEETALLGLWLAAAGAEGGSISWVPLYPQPLENERAAYAEAHSKVSVDPQDLESLASLEAVRSPRAWWDEIIVLDLHAAEQIAAAGGAEMQVLPTWREPQSALRGQVLLIQQLCENHKAWLADEGLLDQILLATAEPAHLRTTLGQFELIQWWDRLGGQTALRCDHPWAD